MLGTCGYCGIYGSLVGTYGTANVCHSCAFRHGMTVQQSTNTTTWDGSSNSLPSQMIEFNPQPFTQPYMQKPELDYEPVTEDEMDYVRRSLGVQ